MSHNLSTSYHPRTSDWFGVGHLTQATAVESSPGKFMTTAGQQELPSLWRWNNRYIIQFLVTWQRKKQKKIKATWKEMQK